MKKFNIILVDNCYAYSTFSIHMNGKFLGNFMVRYGEKISGEFEEANEVYKRLSLSNRDGEDKERFVEFSLLVMGIIFEFLLKKEKGCRGMKKGSCESIEVVV